MSDAIIVLNAGSSSLKFSVFGVTGQPLNLIAHGQIEGLGTAPRFIAKDQRGRVLADLPLQSLDPKNANSAKHGATAAAADFDHSAAFAYIAHWIRARYAAEYSPIGIGHRIVHGGANFTAPVRIDPHVLAELEKLIPLAPLHQPHNLAAVTAVMRSQNNLPQVACFDTAFHQKRPKVTQRFGLPDEYFQQGIRRWGFHGLSYESIAARLCGIAPALARGKVIVAHLGSGASLCALRAGRCVDTTMSFSVLDGLPMGTRCGSLDPGVILYLLQQGMTCAELEDLLYKKSGLLGISGVSNDVRDLLKSDNPLAAEAIDFFVYRIIREIGSLAAALGGLDGLIFTAGVGENSAVIRQRICQGLTWLHLAIDPAANEQNAACISPSRESPSLWVIPTDEEGVIAAHTLAVIRAAGKT